MVNLLRPFPERIYFISKWNHQLKYKYLTAKLFHIKMFHSNVEPQLYYSAIFISDWFKVVKDLVSCAIK